MTALAGSSIAHITKALVRVFSLATLVAIFASGCGSKAVEERTPPTLGPMCSSGPIAVVEPRSIDSIGDTLANGCVDDTGFIAWQSAPAGASCQTPADCAPVCCPCAIAGREALTSWCDHGTCATAADVCCALVGTSLHSCGAP